MEKVSWWEIADWTQGNNTIAAIFNLNKSVVARRRKKLGLPNSTNKPGWPKGKSRTLENRQKMLGQKNRQINDPDYEWPNKSKFDTKPNQRYRQAAKRTYGSACEICRYDKPGISNHVHHIVARSQGGKHTIRNACVLCSRCHDEVHAGILKIPDKILERINAN